MEDPNAHVRPTKRKAIRSPIALGLLALFFVFYLSGVMHFLGPRLAGQAIAAYWLLVLACIALGVVRRVLSPSLPRPEPGRRLELCDGVLRQLDGERVVGAIDVRRPFEYEIVDRYDLARAVFRLYQDDHCLAFRISDPGGLETVEHVMQIEWPPRPRHVSRSFPPSLQ